MALTWSKLNYCAWFDGTVCEQPALVCHGLQLPCVAPDRLARVQIWTVRSYSFVQFKFRYMAMHKQSVLQWSPASVGLAQARPK